MALRDFFTSAAPTRKSQAPANAQPAQDLQVDYSHTQWRYAQMLQQERGYLAACASVDAATA